MVRYIHLYQSLSRLYFSVDQTKQKMQDISY